MADYILNQLGSPTSVSDTTKILKSTNLSNTQPVFDDTVARLGLPSIPEEVYLLSTLFSGPPIPMSVPTRPSGGQLWPRGVYNK